MFDSKAFQSQFKSSINALKKSENITRSELRSLSVSTLDALHSLDNPLNEDIRFINEVLNVLTPVNKKVAVLYFKAFSGFHYDATEMQFTKKNKKTYDDVRPMAIEFISDPLNNIWAWADRNIEIEAKPFDIAKALEHVFKKALKDKEGEAITVAQLDILKAVMAAGISEAVLLEFMSTLGYEEQA